MSKKEIEKEVDEEEEETDEEEGVDEEAEKVAKKISTFLNLDELNKKIDKLVGRDADAAKKIFSEIDTMKDKDEMTKEEKIVAFFTALVKNDTPVLKALSEGVAADGGYLFPDEFKAELIRDLEEEAKMRGLVRVVPMKKDIMKIPKLGSRPKLRWTSENAAKSTKIVVAIDLVRNLLKNWVNCWNTLKFISKFKAISSQALA